MGIQLWIQEGPYKESILQLHPQDEKIFFHMNEALNIASVKICGIVKEQGRHRNISE